jgi:hypothetical protein
MEQKEQSEVTLTLYFSVKSECERCVCSDVIVKQVSSPKYGLKTQNVSF